MTASDDNALRLFNLPPQLMAAATPEGETVDTPTYPDEVGSHRPNLHRVFMLTHSIMNACM